jgi:hypothetical protein
MEDELPASEGIRRYTPTAAYCSVPHRARPNRRSGGNADRLSIQRLEASIGMKTLLVPTEAHDGMAGALESAALVAEKFAAYIEGFALSSYDANLFTLDPGSGIVIEQLGQDAAERSRQARDQFNAYMNGRGISRGSGMPSNAVSWGWIDWDNAGDPFVGSYGRVFDLIVLGKPTNTPPGPRMETLEAAIFESGRPILMAPETPPKRIGETILIAWNCSTEQARTTALAMPLLRRAKRVIVLTTEGGTVPGPSGEQLTRSLRLNDIPAEHRSASLEGRTTGQVILAEAEALGCDLLIKGAYTQSRLRQWIFGGATRHILTNATLPVLIAH